MHVQLLVIVSALAAGLSASPLEARDTAISSIPTNGYTELYREAASNGEGQLIYFGLDDNSVIANSSESESLEKRAPCTRGGSLSCSNDHAARNDVCANLVQELQNDYNVNVKASPRQICYLGPSDKNAYCCVSWHNVVPNLVKCNLYDIAYNSK
jgi:hypothetical protein